MRFPEPAFSFCSTPSNAMYRGFVYAEDAIADFAKGLGTAVYTFSRNLSRAVTR